jgi:hypothetical protein
MIYYEHLFLNTMKINILVAHKYRIVSKYERRLPTKPQVYKEITVMMYMYTIIYTCHNASIIKLR